MSDIDWKKVHTARIAACCSKAAADFDLSVEVPFILNEGTPHQTIFIALFPGIGPANGVLVCLASEWEQLQKTPGAEEYTCVGLYPEHYSQYSKSQWEKNIQEWGVNA
jgi:hypothetical protein